LNRIAYRYVLVISAPREAGGLQRRGGPQDLCFFSLSLIFLEGARRFPVDRKFDGKGRPYHSEMLVADNPWGEGLYAMEPVFWSGLTINSLASGSPNTGPNPSALTTGADAWSGCPT